MYDSLLMMMIFLKVAYDGGDLAKTVADRRNVTEKREKIGGREMSWNDEF
jgi:hypothetical protein